MSTLFKSLELWRHALVASVRGDAPDLSARQMALLLSVYMGEGPHTVRGLASALKISKPAVSRALDRLGELGYIRRLRDELDRRNVLVQQTPAGALFLTDYARMIAEASVAVAAMPDRTLALETAEPMSSESSSYAQSASWVEAAA